MIKLSGSIVKIIIPNILSEKRRDKSDEWRRKRKGEKNHFFYGISS